MVMHASIYWRLCVKNGSEGPPEPYEYEPYEYDGVVKNGVYKILWDFTVQCDIEIGTGRIPLLIKPRKRLRS